MLLYRLLFGKLYVLLCVMCHWLVVAFALFVVVFWCMTSGLVRSPGGGGCVSMGSDASLQGESYFYYYYHRYHEYYHYYYYYYYYY